MAERKLFLSIVLHAHLPWVVHHGTWPHGLDWLHEAAAETYLPLLQLLGRLERDGIAPGVSIDLSPILLEQLTHPVFQEKFPEYLRRKIAFAQDDEAAFRAEGEDHLAGLARGWQRWYGDTLAHFEGIGGNIVGAFRRLGEAGTVQLMTCCATHGYSPLLGTDESVRAQVRLAVLTHRRHFGAAPRGIWLPECGYRPGGYWTPPVAGEDGRNFPAFYRIGVEHALLESGLRFFIGDGHLVRGGTGFGSPFGSFHSALSGEPSEDPLPQQTEAGLCRPYRVADKASEEASGRTSVFPRDPRTGFQVWSGDAGYPADGVYLDFHKKRSPGGLRYWRVTGPGIALDEKAAYEPDTARERAGIHGRHFVSLVRDELERAAAEGGPPPVLCSPFDAELFGHWWFEGVAFLEAVLREVATPEAGLKPLACAAYLQRYPAQQTLALPEGSWGDGGDDRVWLNEQTRWTWSRLYSAEHTLRELCTAGEWRDGGLGERIMKQMCRELLLLESSDWPFLITTGAARDYAERRFREHADLFDELRGMWLEFRRAGRLTDPMAGRLGAIEWHDGPFPEVNPEFWVLGAKATIC